MLELLASVQADDSGAGRAEGGAEEGAEEGAGAVLTFALADKKVCKINFDLSLSKEEMSFLLFLLFYFSFVLKTARLLSIKPERPLNGTPLDSVLAAEVYTPKSL